MNGAIDWIERQVFPATDNRCQQICESHDCLCCSQNQSWMATPLCADLASSNWL